MPKRPIGSPVGGPRKRGRRAKGKDGEENPEAERDEDLLYQMRRRQIIEAGDEEEAWVRELQQEEGGDFVFDIYIPPKINRTEHPHTGERLVIEKIVCENFKSYGGVKSMGPFHK